MGEITWSGTEMFRVKSRVSTDGCPKFWIEIKARQADEPNQLVRKRLVGRTRLPRGVGRSASLPGSLQAVTHHPLLLLPLYHPPHPSLRRPPSMLPTLATPCTHRVYPQLFLAPSRGPSRSTRPYPPTPFTNESLKYVHETCTERQRPGQRRTPAACAVLSKHCRCIHTP